MEFTLQSYEILIIGLMVMGLFLAIIPVRPVDTRLRGYRISLILMALSFIFLGTYCVFKARLPRELLFIPFFVSSHLQVCLLGLAHLNLLNLNIVRRKQILLNFCPMLACAAVYLAVQLLCPFVRLTSWHILFHSLTNPGVVVRVVWLFVYIGQIIYYAVVFFRQERIYSEELGNFLSDAPDSRYRLALYSFIGALAAGFDSVCICLTLDKFWGGLFNLVMLALYAVMCALFVQYPSIFFKISSIVAGAPERTPSGGRADDSWPVLKERISAEKLFIVEGLTLEQLAGTLRVSKDSLSKMINTKEGVNFNTFIGALRVAEAQSRMQEHPEMSFSDLATAVGYSEQSNFSRQFKAITGFTPGEYRKRIQMG
ncbi:MAG: AraC family transcriptional regulator [Bacteroidales bacterium]|nr:AraC family transcriptional regulator [Bacteroidales bacterium]